MRDDERVDWTMSDAPPAGEAPTDAPLPGLPARRPTPPRRPLSRRTWLVVGALPVLALLFTAVYARLENQRLQSAVEAVVGRQEQARLDGNWTRLRATFADAGLGWAVQRVTLLRSGTGGVPMPINLPGFWQAPLAGRVTQFKMLGATLARADVTREYEAPDGARLTLTLPQFYQFADEAWRETAPPAPSADQALALHGAYVDVDYFPADAALAASLAHDLDALLTAACADWNCPADLRVPVRFETGDTFRRDFTLPADTFLDSWALQVIAARQTGTLVREVTLPTGLEGGYGADAAAAEAVRRVAGITALLRAAQRLAPETAWQGDNAYLDGLVAREAARLGLDAPQLAQARLANPLFTPAELWRLGQDSYANASAYGQALVILNQLLAGRGLADERQLLHTLDTAGEPGAWLAGGLGLTVEQATANLVAAAAISAPMPGIQRPAFTPELALNCSSGPLLAALDGQTAPLFPAGKPDAFIRAWAPGGRRLAVSVAGRLGMVDLETSAGTWAPQPALPYAYPVRWASDTVLAYPPVTRDPTSQPVQILTTGIGLWNAGSGQYLAALDGANEYVLSPDGAWAALVGAPYFAGPTLSVVPALGGSAIFSTTLAESPAWARDSRRLVYSQHEAAGTHLVIFDQNSGLTRTVLTGRDPRLSPPPDNGATRLTAVWAPGADQLLIDYSFNPGQGGGWAGLLSSDGRDFMALPAPGPGPAPAPLGALFPAGFAADGQFLAETVVDGANVSAAIYSADGQFVRFIADARPSGWSPAGHTLALLGADGASLLRAPDDANAAPERLAPAGCSQVVWRP